MRARAFKTVLMHFVAACAFTCPAALAADTYFFDIPAGHAEDAIAIFSEQSHRLILMSGEALVGITTPAVRGKYETTAALTLLLKNVGLQIVYDDGKTILLKRGAISPPPPAGKDAHRDAAQGAEVITVTGYRASLASSTNAKRVSIGFSDVVFAEDIGKFPDTNIAEALNRIPGVTIAREINGEGFNVQIRGLGTNFTKILLNGNPIAIASTGVTDATNTNREVDLNMFPTELFTQLSVSKTLSADQIEGGAAGSVSMRSIRPFDHPGSHFNYDLQLTDQSTTNLAIGKRGVLIVSDTDGPWGILAAVAGVQSSTFIKGYEDGNGSWYGPNIPPGMCAAAGTTNACAQFGSSAWTVPTTIQSGVFVPIPAGYALDAGFTAQTVGGVNYLPINYPVNQRLLYALNPGLADAACSTASPSVTCLNQVSTRLSNALLPRLGRPMYEKGSRDRYSGVLSIEYRPSDSTQFFFDAIFGKIENHMNRTSAGWGVRTGASSSQMIPAGLTLSESWLNSSLTGGVGGAVQKGTFYNPTFGLEARDYRETGDFLNVNPGLSWQSDDLLKIEVQANYSSSHFFRRNPTVMVSSCTGGPLPIQGIDNCPNGFPGIGTTLAFDASGVFPVEKLNIDLNDPKNFEWNLGRVNLNGEKRWTTTQGMHLDVTYGDDRFAVKSGFAYDVSYRLIRAYDDSTTWSDEICGNYPSFVVYGPNTAMPACTGQSTTGVPAGWYTPTFNGYAGWGTGASAGQAPLTFSGSLVPTSQLHEYLQRGPAGFITVDYAKIFAASDYWRLYNSAVTKLACVPKCNRAGTVEYPVFLVSTIDERTVGLYSKAFGTIDIGDGRLKYDVGLRWVETRQFIRSPSVIADPRNATLSDGGKYLSYQSIAAAKSKYQAFLPSASLVYEIADAFQIRASISRTMTRANPGDMRATMDFGDPTVSTATLGNPKLKPFFSNNFDLGADFFTGGEGYVGVTAFRKSISGFTAQITTQRTFSYLAQYGITFNTLGATQQTAYRNGGPSGISCNSDAACADQPIYVNQQMNLPGLEIINGFEVTVVQPLDWLTRDTLGLEGLGVTGNLTVVDQKSTGSVPVFAVGVAPYQFNLTGFYESDGVMLRLSYNWNDTSYNSPSQSGGTCLPVQAQGLKPVGCPAGAYIFTKAYGQADFASSLRLSNLFGELPGEPELTFDIQNIFNAKQRSYLMFPDTIHTYYIMGRNFLLGIRGSF